MRSVFLIAVLLLAMNGVAEEDMFRARLRVEKSRNMILTPQGMAYLPSCQIQKGNGVFFEAEQMYGLQYNHPETRLQKDIDCISLIHVRFLEFRFEITTPGSYRAWYRATFPTNLGYSHWERMDEGETHSVEDSNRLAPNVWRWCKGPLYHLDKGKHIWSFPSPHAWCGGTKLDSLLLIPEKMTDAPEGLKMPETEVRIPEQGEIFLRRIKASLLKKWRLGVDMELNGGNLAAEYRYDDGAWRMVRFAEWESVPDNAEYLFFHFRMKRAEGKLLSPFIHNLELLVQEK